MMTDTNDTHPTQDITPWDESAEPSEPQGWGKAVCTNSEHPSRVLHDLEVHIGRKSSCHLQVKHAAISGVHCTLHHLPDTHLTFLTDHSTNGTWVDGRKAEKGKRVRVLNGSEILLIRNASEKISYIVHHHHTAEEQRRRKEEEDDERQGGPFDKYELSHNLGTGAFAVVKLCVERDTGRQYACKIIEKKKFALNHGSKRGEALMDEVKILQKLNHPHIIQIHDVYDTARHLYLILELVTGGDLFDKIIAQNGKGFAEARAAIIFHQLLDATEYLHSHNIVHRDLKPENVLLVKPDSDAIKLSDFGLSRMIGDGSTMKTLCGTPQYLAPEVLNEQLSVVGYDKAVDLWSLGVILYVLLTGMAPFNENKNLIDEVKNGRYSFPAAHWASKSRSSITLIRGLLTMDPAKRWTIEQVRHSEWMRSAALGVSSISIPMAGGGGGGGGGSSQVAPMSLSTSVRGNGRKRSAAVQQRAAESSKRVKGEDEKEEKEKGDGAAPSRRGRSSRQR